MAIQIRNKMRASDYHIVINGDTKTGKIFNGAGKLVPVAGEQNLFEARCYGQHSDWTKPNGDTPPGKYLVGIVYDTPGEYAYGRYCVDLIDLDGQETGNGRAGISLHGGGSGLASPFSDWQGWQSTHGCVRVQNWILTQVLVPLIKRVQAAGGKVYLTVHYEKGFLA